MSLLSSVCFFFLALLPVSLGPDSLSLPFDVYKQQGQITFRFALVAGRPSARKKFVNLIKPNVEVARALGQIYGRIQYMPHHPGPGAR